MPVPALSFALDVGELHDLAPLLQFRLDVSDEFVESARHRQYASRKEQISHLLRAQDFADLAIEPLEDGGGKMHGSNRDRWQDLLGVCPELFADRVKFVKLRCNNERPLLAQTV